jgi:hypothetical protein
VSMAVKRLQCQRPKSLKAAPRRLLTRRHRYCPLIPIRTELFLGERNRASEHWRELIGLGGFGWD